MPSRRFPALQRLLQRLLKRRSRKCGDAHDDAISRLASTPRPQPLPALPVNQLPTELLIPIFRHVLDSETDVDGFLDAILSVAGVCRLWKNVLFGAPELWRRAVFAANTEPKSRGRHNAVLALCGQLSECTLTHASIRTADIRPAHYDHHLNILRRSLPSLVDVDVQFQSHSTTFPSSERLAPRRGRGTLDPSTKTLQDAFVEMLALLSQARNLNRLTFSSDVAVWYDPLDPSTPTPDPMPHDFRARPKTVLLVDPLRDGDGPMAADLAPFLTQLCSEAEHLALRTQDYAYCAVPHNRHSWHSWSWSLLRRRAQALRSFDAHLHPCVRDEMAHDALLFPVLEHATIDCLTYLREQPLAWLRDVWMEMPMLDTLKTRGVIADLLDTPMLRHARVLLFLDRDVGALIDAMDAWPQLESLTICLTGRDTVLDTWARSALGCSVINRILKALIPSRCDQEVRLPNLRHLGITNEPAADMAPCDAAWAAQPWCAGDALSWPAFWGHARLRTPQHLNLAYLEELESERRALHLTGVSREDAGAGAGAGADTDAENDTVFPCVPLESIKLKGFELGSLPWGELQAHTRVQITSYPDPAAKPRHNPLLLVEKNTRNVGRYGRCSDVT